MKKYIRIMTAVYKNIQLVASDAKNVRGFFADLDWSDSVLHNHTGTGESIYRYPKVQYKVLKGNPVIVALEEGIRSVHPLLMEQTELKIGRNKFYDMSMDIRLAEMPLGDHREMKEYYFATPWLALNQENYKRFENADQEEREAILERILTGNILSMCKGLGVTIENKLQVRHQLRSVPVSYKGKKMEGFVGDFQINCCIPELCGIGKGTSRGFGKVKIRKDKGVAEE